MSVGLPEDLELGTFPCSHEGIVLINGLQCSLFLQYSIYALFAIIFQRFFLKDYPIDSVAGPNDVDHWFVKYLGALNLLGCTLCLIGSANLLLRYQLPGLLILISFVGYDLYSIWTCRLNGSKGRDFQVFRSLFTSIIKLVRFVCTTLNLYLLFNGRGF